MPVPDIKEEAGGHPPLVSVKGQLPRRVSGVSLHEVYPQTPGLGARDAYERIRAELTRATDLVHSAHPGQRGVSLPVVADDREAWQLIVQLFDPAIPWLDLTAWNPDPKPAAPSSIIRLDVARPFPLHLASPEKFRHTLAWVDTNIKLGVERMADALDLPPSVQAPLVRACFRIYSYLLKMQDSLLVQSMNFNYSMFFQDRILQLVSGGRAHSNDRAAREPAILANRIALDLLKGLGAISYRQLCTLSVFMGIVWASSPELQAAHHGDADATLSKIQAQLESLSAHWGIDHIDRFLSDMTGKGHEFTVAVILDDNGESVFDVAIFQRLLEDNDSLRVVFILNAYGVSNNMAVDSLRDITREDYFAPLRRHVDSGTVTFCIERQPFRSFEPAWLRPSTREALRTAPFCYVKGVNFFETLQMPANVRYHCFTVHGQTCAALTGCQEGAGVFARLPPGVVGYDYRSAEEVRTLAETVAWK